MLVAVRGGGGASVYHGVQITYYTGTDLY